MTLNFAVVIPMANEANDFDLFITSLCTVLDALEAGKVYLVVDKVSKDNTLELCRNLSLRDNRFNTVWSPGNKNVVDAYLAGYREAIRNKHSFIIEMDAGLSHDPQALPDFLRLLRDGYDCVFGSRFIKGGSIVDSNWKRYFLSRAGTILSNLLLGSGMRDMTSGYQAFRAEVVEQFLSYKLLSAAHFYQTELRYLLRKTHYIEIPIHYRAPSPSISRKSIYNSLQVLFHYFILRLRGKSPALRANVPFLVITSIATQEHPVVKRFAAEAGGRNMPFILIGDAKSPANFNLPGCDFYSIERQLALPFELCRLTPTQHYSRKNIGYLIAISQGAGVIIETDDDNYPFPTFWNQREKMQRARPVENKGWVNIYGYFTKARIWPRGFPLNEVQHELPSPDGERIVCCPIQQGLADENPDVDAIYRLILPLPVDFAQRPPVALGRGTVCPFNSQNTSWFREAFPLLYLPAFCSFRMTDIWRSFVAQRICWENGWSVLFHQATVRQERNTHDLLHDFSDEIQGYLCNHTIMQNLQQLSLKPGVEHIPDNMSLCYEQFIRMNLIDRKELSLLNAWLNDLSNIKY
jgi:glycosyltransferase involved in cell wall biosynthesis